MTKITHPLNKVHDAEFASDTNGLGCLKVSSTASQIMAEISSFVSLSFCAFYYSHQRSKIMQEKLVLIPPLSQSSCGWPGKALLLPCPHNGNLGKDYK